MSAPSQFDPAIAEACWGRHVAALKPRAEAALHGPHSSWTARDEYAHVARWMGVAAARVRAARDGRPRPELDGDPNLRWQAEDRAIALSDARARADQERRALLAEVARLPAGEDGDGLRALAAGDLVAHLDEHFGFIVDGLLASEQTAWDELVARLDAAPAGALYSGGGLEWSAGSVFAHLARWFDFATTSLEGAHAGRAMIDVPDVNETNAAWLAADRGLAAAAAKARAIAGRQRLLTIARSFTAAQWTAPALNRLDGNTLDHYREHLSYLGG